MGRSSEFSDEISDLIDAEFGKDEIEDEMIWKHAPRSKKKEDQFIKPCDCIWYPLINRNIYEFNTDEGWEVDYDWTDYNLFTVDPIDRDGSPLTPGNFTIFDETLPFPFLQTTRDSLPTYEIFFSEWKDNLYLMKSRGKYSSLKINLNLIDDFPTRFEMEKGLGEDKCRAKITYSPFSPDEISRFLKEFYCILQIDYHK